MGTYQDAFIIGTSNRLFGLYGFDNNDFQVRELSREVGCIENTSVQEFDGRANTNAGSKVKEPGGRWSPAYYESGPKVITKYDVNDA